MKVLVLLGSRNPEGQTAKAVEALLHGLDEGGVPHEAVSLPTLDLRRCEQCGNDGWGSCRAEGRCQLDDDFEQVAAEIREAGWVVVATPVYFSDVSESLRATLDRLRRICCHEDGRRGIAGTPALGICVAGGGGGGSPACSASLDRALATAGFDVVDMIPVRRQNSALKHEVLTLTGRWMAEQLAAPPA